MRITMNLGFHIVVCVLTLITCIEESLRKKMPLAVLMFEKTKDSNTYIVGNGIRHDKKANALDQEPYRAIDMGISALQQSH